MFIIIITVANSQESRFKNILAIMLKYLNVTRFVFLKARYQQSQTQQITTQSPGQDLSAVLTPQTQISTTTVVSETNEVRIESVAAYRDAGNYECVAHNSVTHNIVYNGPSAASASNTARMSMDLEVECEFNN